MDKFASYVIFFLIIKLKKKKVFEFHLNYFFLFISSSLQPKILTIYTYSFLVFHYFYYVLYNYLLYSSFLLSTLPTTLQVIFFCSFIKLNRFCVFVAFILYIIWFLPTSFIDRLKFYVWSHLLVFFLEVNIASNIFVFFNFLLHDYLLLTSIFYNGFNL